MMPLIHADPERIVFLGVCMEQKNTGEVLIARTVPFYGFGEINMHQKQERSVKHMHL